MTPETWAQIVNGLVALALALLVPLITVGINALLKKAKLDDNAAIQAAVRSGIAFAEEQGASFLKTQGKKLDPSVKLNAAVERVLVKVPGITQAEAEGLVHEQLPQVSLGASSFLNATANAVKQ
jgi:hypothetical protein